MLKEKESSITYSINTSLAKYRLLMQARDRSGTHLYIIYTFQSTPVLILYIRHRFNKDYEQLSQSHSNTIYIFKDLPYWISCLNVTDNNPVNSDKVSNKITGFIIRREDLFYLSRRRYGTFLMVFTQIIKQEKMTFKITS